MAVSGEGGEGSYLSGQMPLKNIKIESQLPLIVSFDFVCLNSYCYIEETIGVLVFRYCIVLEKLIPQLSPRWNHRNSDKQRKAIFKSLNIGVAYTCINFPYTKESL